MGRSAAVDRELHPIQEARIVRSKKKQRDRRNFLRTTHLSRGIRDSNCRFVSAGASHDVVRSFLASGGRYTQSRLGFRPGCGVRRARNQLKTGSRVSWQNPPVRDEDVGPFFDEELGDGEGSLEVTHWHREKPRHFMEISHRSGHARDESSGLPPARKSWAPGQARDESSDLPPCRKL